MKSVSLAINEKYIPNTEVIDVELLKNIEDGK